MPPQHFFPALSGAGHAVRSALCRGAEHGRADSRNGERSQRRLSGGRHRHPDNEATHATRDVQSGANGEYIFIEMPVGTYEINVAQAGFKRYVRKGV